MSNIKSINDIAHQLRSNTGTIAGSANAVKNTFSQLIDGYKQAKAANLPIQFLSNEKLTALENSFTEIIRTTEVMYDLTEELGRKNK